MFSAYIICTGFAMYPPTGPCMHTRFLPCTQLHAGFWASTHLAHGSCHVRAYTRSFSHALTNTQAFCHVLASNCHVYIQGFRSDLWWRKPAGESLTVKVGDQSITDLSRVALYVQVPWVGSSSFQQIFVLYQASQHPSALCFVCR